MTHDSFLKVLYLFIASDIIASGIGSYALWSHRKINGSSVWAIRLAMLLMALCFEGIETIIAHTGYGFASKPVYTVGYAWHYWIGRTARSVGIWWFVLRVLGKKTARH